MQGGWKCGIWILLKKMSEKTSLRIFFVSSKETQLVFFCWIHAIGARKKLPSQIVTYTNLYASDI